MAVHFIHVSKTGGTAVKHAIRESRRRRGGRLLSPWGPVRGHHHDFRLCEVPRGDKAVVPLRDPISRFQSGFYSRQREGAPRFKSKWSDEERQSFEWFPTPGSLADALAEPPSEARARAEFAMKSIRHLRRRLTLWTGEPPYLRSHLDTVLYVARQETLEDDWERLKELLDLPSEVVLPRGKRTGHRTTYPDDDPGISEKGAAALRAWYATDYEVLEIGEAFRQRRVKPRRPLLHRLRRAAAAVRVT
jgi:hypothetical protein